MKHFFGGLIHPFERQEGPPPKSFGAFIRWCLAGSLRVIGIAALAGIVVGALESLGALLIGGMMDDALASDPASYFADNWPMVLLLAVFFMGLRPAAMGLSAALNAISLGPNIFPQILTRLNRHTLGQSLKFFDDDFAGRLAQKQIQTSNALTEAVVEIVNSMTFALATVIGTGLVLAQVDWRLTVLLILWLIAYILLIRWYLPKVRRLAKARAEARAAVTGQIVDTLSNMAVVKLFAHVGREEEGAEKAIGNFREKALDFGVMAAGFRALLMLLAGTLPVLLISAALFLWQHGEATAGDIAIAGMVSTRIAQMSGWISFTAMVIFAHLGEAEDGMRTLTPGHDLKDPPAPKPMTRAKGAIRFEAVDYHYGNDGGGGLSGFDLTIEPGKRSRWSGAPGPGKPRRFHSSSGSMMSRAGG